MWGVAAGVLDLIPCVGSIAIAIGPALVAYLQFGTLEMAVVVSGASLVIHGLEAFLLTPWLTSRANEMSLVAIFLACWRSGLGLDVGIWGLLMGVPIPVIIKAICDRIDDFKSVGELLGD